MTHGPTRASALALLLLTAPLASCGGDDDDAPACRAPASCGGDVVGTWKVEDTCLTSMRSSMDMCPNATVDGRDLRITGTYTFGADKTYTSQTVTNGTMKMTFPETCLRDDDGTTLTCAQLGALLTAFAALGGGNELVASCSGTSTCSCTMTFTNAAADASGTYSTADNQLTLRSSDPDEEPETNGYCVSGSSLTLATGGGAGGFGSASMRLVKQ